MIMENILGEARGQLIHINEEERLVDSTADQNLELINKYTQKPLTRDDVNVKSMWLCNDIIDCYYSRFNETTLNELADLCPGAAVMVAHNTESLPIGRFFKASVVRREDSRLWLRAWFYWPKEMDHSDNMLKGIESGLYNEVSVSWRMEQAICSICGKDMRSMECPHIPGRKYPDADGTEQLCFWESKNILAFNEGSLVYKGGQVGTSIDDERKKLLTQRSLILDKKTVDIHEQVRDKAQEIAFDALPAGKYNICPNYDCQIIRIEGSKILMNDIDISTRLRMISDELKDNKESYSGYIFRKRGNSRLHRDIFQKWFDSNEIDDHTIFIKVFDNRTTLKDTSHVQAIKFISPETYNADIARTVASKDGCIFFNDTTRYIIKELNHDTQDKDRNKVNNAQPKKESGAKNDRSNSQSKEEIGELSDKDCEDMIDEDADERAKWTSKKKKELPDAAFCPSLIKTVDGKKTRKCPHHNANVKSATESSSLDRAHLTAALRLVGKVQGFSSSAISAAKAHLAMHQRQLEGRMDGGLYRTWDGSKQYFQFQIDHRWYKTPTSVATSMIFKEVETLDVNRSMLLGDIETSTEDGVLTITSKLITGRYRVSNTTLNGQKLKVVKLITDNLQ